MKMIKKLIVSFGLLICIISCKQSQKITEKTTIDTVKNTKNFNINGDTLKKYLTKSEFDSLSKLNKDTVIIKETNRTKLIIEKEKGKKDIKIDCITKDIDTFYVDTTIYVYNTIEKVTIQEKTFIEELKDNLLLIALLAVVVLLLFKK